MTVASEAWNALAIVAILEINAVGVVNTLVFAGEALVYWADDGVVETGDPVVPFYSRKIS